MKDRDEDREPRGDRERENGATSGDERKGEPPVAADDTKPNLTSAVESPPPAGPHDDLDTAE